MMPFKILDGAMGSELIKRGLILPNHVWSAEANINHPQLVQQIHREYVDSGADYITANTFRTTPRAYRKTGINNKKALQMAKYSLFRAIEHAKNGGGPSTKIIASFAPLEDCYKPELFPCRDSAIAEYTLMGKWMIETEVDILLLETMNSMAETEAGLYALNETDLPIWVSFVLKDENHLLSGDRLADALNMLNNCQIDMVLLNCNSLDCTKRAVYNIVDNWIGNWGIYPNLGKGETSIDGSIAECESMEKYLSVIEHAINSGASVVGACCGSSPEHIAEIKSLKCDIAE